MLVQTSLGQAFVDLLNSILHGVSEIPPSWYEGRSKVCRPKTPKDLRPVVLAPVTCKLFTKLLLIRTRNSFVPIRSGQLCAQEGWQSLDGSLAFQGLIHLSFKWNLPLVACKLDISAAFGSLHHAATGKFLCSCKPSNEAKLLQTMLGMCGETWTQKLHKGIQQGSYYSAELFARVLDGHLGSLVATWKQEFGGSWLQDMHAIIYADDILLLATSTHEMRIKLQGIREHLKLIGLQLAVAKCQFMCSKDLGNPLPESSPGQPVKQVTSFVFLGVLLGFSVSPVQKLGRAMGRAMNTFWAMYGILKAGLPLSRNEFRYLGPLSPPDLAVAPSGPVLRFLATAHTNLLMSIVAPASDRLCGSLSNWVSRRRCVRIVCQHLEFAPWPVTTVLDSFCASGDMRPV